MCTEISIAHVAFKVSKPWMQHVAFISNEIWVCLYMHQNLDTVNAARRHAHFQSEHGVFRRVLGDDMAIARIHTYIHTYIHTDAHLQSPRVLRSEVFSYHVCTCWLAHVQKR